MFFMEHQQTNGLKSKTVCGHPQTVLLFLLKSSEANADPGLHTILSQE